MRVRPVQTTDDLELVRRIRNACRRYMTRDRRYLSAAEQAEWWAAAPRDLWLFEDVAYALLSEREGKTWISLGMFADARGKGLGTAIYAHFPGIWAEIGADNIASRRAAEKAGYTFVSEEDGLVVMQG